MEMRVLHAMSVVCIASLCKPAQTRIRTVELLGCPQALILFDATAIICLGFYYFDSELVVGKLYLS